MKCYEAALSKVFREQRFWDFNPGQTTGQCSPVDHSPNPLKQEQSTDPRTVASCPSHSATVLRLIFVPEGTAQVGVWSGGGGPDSRPLNLLQLHFLHSVTFVQRTSLKMHIRHTQGRV